MAVEEIRREGKEDADEDTFMMSYSSLMILLLTFMILMVTLAQIKEPRFRQAIGSLRGALAFLPHTGGDDMSHNGSTGFLPRELLRRAGEGDEVYEEAVRQIRRKASTQKYEGLEVEESEEGLRIRIGDAVMFERGSADLKPEAHPLLDLVAAAVIARSRRVAVAGHTCDLPISTRQFPSNWDLAMARAINVVHYLVSRSVSPDSLFAYGFADEIPIVPNASEINRRRNRRVEIYLARTREGNSHE